MNGAVRLVAMREIITRLRSRAFKISTIGMLVLLVGGILLIKLAGVESTHTIGLTPSAAPLSAPLTATGASFDYTIETVAVDQATGEAQVRSGELDALITGTPDDFGVVVQREVGPTLNNVLTTVARQAALDRELTEVGADPAEVSAAVAAASFDVRGLEPPRDFQVGRLVLAYIAGILVYIAILIYGQVVAQGVVEEKTSRVVELLLTTIRPWQLLLGKVLGIGIVGLAQILLTAAAGIATGLATDAITFPTSIAAEAATWAVVWFLLGYLLYALLFAALGALVSRQEEVGGATAPIQVLVIVPYVVAISVLPVDPENRLAEILSLIPLFSPLIMPFRSALGVAPAWQLWLTVALTAATVVAAVWFAGRVYRNAVLRTGSKVRLRDALRSAR